MEKVAKLGGQIIFTGQNKKVNDKPVQESNVQISNKDA